MKYKIILVAIILGTIIINGCKKEKVEPELEFYVYDHNDGNGGNNDVVFNGIWQKKKITWFISRYCNEISENETDKVIKEAFGVWSKWADLDFVQVYNKSDADITLSFQDNLDHWVVSEDHQCPLIFGKKTLGHAFPPNQIDPTDQIFEGDVHFNDNFKWTPYGEGKNKRPISLLSVAIHEIGHSLGLTHSQNKSSIMFGTNTNQNFLDIEDIERIIDLYGRKGNNSGGGNTNSSINITGLCPSEVNVGQSQNFVMTISNTSTSDLVVSGYEIQNNTGAFSFVYNKPSFPLTIKPGGNYTVTHKFAPSFAGLHNSTFVVNSNATQGNSSADLVGNGVAQSNSNITCNLTKMQWYGSDFVSTYFAECGNFKNWVTYGGGYYVNFEDFGYNNGVFGAFINITDNNPSRSLRSGITFIYSLDGNCTYNSNIVNSLSTNNSIVRFFINLDNFKNNNLNRNYIVSPILIPIDFNGNMTGYVSTPSITFSKQ